MGDKTIIKIDSTHSPHGPLGQLYLATGVGVGMRLWRDQAPGAPQPEVARDYETVGYVISGRAELHSEGQMVLLEPGNAWVVPRRARHAYKILEAFTAVEATHPPAERSSSSFPAARQPSTGTTVPSTQQRARSARASRTRACTSSTASTHDL